MTHKKNGKGIQIGTLKILERTKQMRNEIDHDFIDDKIKGYFKTI